MKPKRILSEQSPEQMFYKFLAILILTSITMGISIAIIILIFAGSMLIAFIIFEFKEHIIPEFKQLFRAIKRRIKEVHKK